MKKIGNSKKIGISIIGILVVLVLAFLILVPKSNADDNAIVYFECKNLKKALNEKLRKSADSEITIKDMHGIKGYVGLGNRDIISMKGIEHLINGTYLDLSCNKISKIEDLDNLTKLRALNLYENKISEIEGLDKLTNLTHLNLSRNKISKIEGLDNLTNLTDLGLSKNQINKIEVLDKLTNLTKLDLSENQINKIEVLDNFTNLNELNLESQKIYLDINSSEFELPKVMYKNEEIEVTISDSFKDNITKIGENRYRIDDEGRKKLKEKQQIFDWIKETVEYSAFSYFTIEFSGEIYAISTSKEKDLFNEEVVKNKCVKIGEKLDITTLLLNKPNGSRVEVAEDINTNTLGKKRGKIKVIFSDGSFKEIEVEVIVNTFDLQINYVDKKEKVVKSEEKEVKIDPEKLR